MKTPLSLNLNVLKTLTNPQQQTVVAGAGTIFSCADSIATRATYTCL